MMKDFKERNSVTDPTTTLLMMPKSMRRSGKDWKDSPSSQWTIHELKRKLYRQSQMSISWKELGSMSPSRARLLLEVFSYGRTQNHWLISRDENQHSSSHKTY